MTSNKEKLLSTIEYIGSRMVITANNSRLPIAHICKTVIRPRFTPNQVQLQDVYHVPGMKKTFLPVAQLTSSCNYVLFGPKYVKMYQNITILGTSIVEDSD